MSQSYVKFYKYEQVKKHMLLQSYKDKKRWKLFEQLENQKQ